MSALSNVLGYIWHTHIKNIPITHGFLFLIKDPRILFPGTILLIVNETTLHKLRA